MNVFETILAAQNDGVRQMAARFGLNEEQARSAVEALLPMLAGAVNHNARQPGGFEALLGALGDGHHQRYLDDPAALQEPGTMIDGNAILSHLFGDKAVSRQVATRAAERTGIGADILKQMLPLLAAMMMGSLSKKASADGMFDSQVPGGMLGGGLGGALGGLFGGSLTGGAAAEFARRQNGGLLDMLTPMLDRNRDGSAIDDMLGMAAQFLARR